MKKIFSILFCALLTVACVEPLQQSLSPVDNKPAEGSKMMLEFSLPVSPATKGAMTHQPEITATSSVHVFVFNAASGALLQVSKATLKGTVMANTPWGTAESAITSHADFEVYVDMGSAHRYLQVVVDAPTYSISEDSTNDNETGIGYANNPIFIGDSEADVASKLYTTGGATAFWQRIDLPHGLQAYTYPGGRPEKGSDWAYTGPHGPASTDESGNTVYKEDYYVDGNHQTVYYGDFVNASGYKITDGTGYVMSTDVANRVKYIPLVRNFVNIRVSRASGGTFTPSKAVLINVPRSGFVAPYSSASGFVSYYLKDGYLNRLQKPEDPETGVKYGTEGIVSTGYTAPVPNDQYDTACPAETKCVSADEDGVIFLYMYERGVATSNPTQLLVKGSFDDGPADRWLKMDITDTDGQYIAFYRDLTYDMEIGAIAGTTGYDEMEEAYNMPSIGNPSASPETQTLTQVSDGQGTTIWVDYIDYASFKSDANEVRLRYKFVGNNKTSADAVLSVTHLTGTGAITSTTLAGDPYNGDDTQDGASGWYYVMVPLAGQGQTAEKSVLRVSGTATNDVGKTVTLYRDVTFSVMPTQTMTVSMSQLDADEKNKSTIATITLPDGLGYSLFPLVIRIEAYNGSLTPTDSDLPVGHGTSTFSTLSSDIPAHSSYLSYQRSTNYYWYEKTISYGEYEAGTRVYTANFKTIYDSGNETVVAFSDPDGHFNTAVTNLRGAPTFKLAGDETTVSVKASETTASFDILSNVGTWTVTADNGAEVVGTRANSTTGSGNASIAVSFPNNMNGTAPKTYTVTVSLDSESQALIADYEPLTFTIEQNEPVQTSITRTIYTTNSTFAIANGTYSGDTFNNEITALSFNYSGSGNELQSTSNNYITLRSNNSNTTTLTISANSITQIVIIWDRENNNNYSVNNNNTTISSGGGNTSFSNGSGNGTNITYPKTTWSNNTGSNSVSLRFSVANNTTARIRQIEVTYNHNE